MSRGRIAVALALVPAALAGLAGGAAAADGSCAPAGARVLRTSRTASLYAQAGELYGCAGSRRTPLGVLAAGRRPLPGTRVVRFQLAGDYAATDAVAMGVDTLSSTLALTNLASGTSVSAPATGPERRPESFTSVVAMALGRRGVLAWVGRRSAIGVPHPAYEVHVLSGRGSVWVGAGSTRPTALRVRGRRVSWRAANGRRRRIDA